MSSGLVISGGGSKGAFAVGVLQQLRAAGDDQRFTHYVGTSTGALIVPLAALGDLALLEQLYSSVHTQDIITKFNIGDRLHMHALFDSSPLWDLINKYYDEGRCRELLRGQKIISLLTTCLQTGQLTVFTNDPRPAPVPHYTIEILKDAEQLRKAILASASQPVFMPPVKVNLHLETHPSRAYQYVDGGVRQYAGLEMAIDQGCQEIVVILHAAAQEPPATETFTDLFSILQKTIDLLLTDIAKNDLIIPLQYNAALEYIESVKQQMRRAGIRPQDIAGYFRIRGKANPYEEKVPLSITLIRPEQPLGGGPGGLAFNPDEMKKMMAIGKSIRWKKA